MPITAQAIMTSAVIALDPEMTLAEMDSLLVKHGVSGAPVVEHDQLVGVASQSDIIRSLWEGQHEASRHATYYSNPFPLPLSAMSYVAKDAGWTGDRLIEHTVRDIMTRDPLVAHPDDPIEQIARRMVDDQIHRLPITELETGRLVGIVSTLDLARAITIYGLASVL